MWLGRYPIVHPDHIQDLEQRAAIHEFGSKLPRHQAEERAHQDYRRDQLIEAAGHHYVGMKASHAAGSPEEAQKHGALYILACRAMGHTNSIYPPDEVAQKAKHLPNSVYNFKAHPADTLSIRTHMGDDKPLTKGEYDLIKADIWTTKHLCCNCSKPMAKHPVDTWGLKCTIDSKTYVCHHLGAIRAQHVKDVRNGLKKDEDLADKKVSLETPEPLKVDVESRRYGDQGRIQNGPHAGKKSPYFKYDDYIPDELKQNPKHPTGITIHQRGRNVIAELSGGHGSIHAFRHGDGGYVLTHDGIKKAHPIVQQYRSHVIRALGDHLKAANGARYFVAD
jgi:hypothetical protein